MTTMFFIKKTSLVFANNLVFSNFSPDGSEKPGMDTTCFSCLKKATRGSSFWGLEKQLNPRGLEEYSGISSLLFL